MESRISDNAELFDRTHIGVGYMVDAISEILFVIESWIIQPDLLELLNDLRNEPHCVKTRLRSLFLSHVVLFLSQERFDFLKLNRSSLYQKKIGQLSV